MSVFNEELQFMKSLEQRQKRIWPDACDLGIEVKDLKDGELLRIRRTVQTLLALPGSKVIWKEDKPAVQRQYQLIIMWGGTGAKMDASHIQVLYYMDRRRNKEFFSVEVFAVTTDGNGNILTTDPKSYTT